jgi:hypothetical protein
MQLKYIKQVSICFILLFSSLTFFTANCKSISDGDDTIGWPLVFYKFLAGKRTDNYVGRGWMIENLILDILLILLITVSIVALIQRFLSRNR